MPRRTVVDPQFPARLRELRAERKLSQRALASTAHTVKSHISELEHGIKTPGVEIARALDKALGADGELAEMVEDETSVGGAKQLASRSLRYHTSESDTVETILDIGRADMKRRSIVSAPFAIAALAAPSRDWLLNALESVSGERGPRQVGMKQVDGIRQMFALFQEMDVMRGGGHGRTALVEYMNMYVLPLARRDHGSEQIQLALYEAASEQAYLVGWMAYDDGLHGLAERYLIQSLRLAQTSGNRTLGAHVLAGMSDQANLLGSPQEALMLARSGQRGIRAEDSPACMTDLLVLEARALAALGEGAAAARAVAAAERTFGQIVPENEPEWARFIDTAYVFGEAAHAFRDLEDTTQIDRFASESAAEAARQRRARRGALSHAALAISYITNGQPEAAADKGLHVVDLAAEVNSSRCIETVRDLYVRLQPYGHLPEVEAFKDQARTKLNITI